MLMYQKDLRHHDVFWSVCLFVCQSQTHGLYFVNLIYKIVYFILLSVDLFDCQTTFILANYSWQVLPVARFCFLNTNDHICHPSVCPSVYLSVCRSVLCIGKLTQVTHVSSGTLCICNYVLLGTFGWNQDCWPINPLTLTFDWSLGHAISQTLLTLFQLGLMLPCEHKIHNLCL